MPTNTYRFPLPSPFQSNGSETAVKLLPLKQSCAEAGTVTGLTLQEILFDGCEGEKPYAIPVCSPCYTRPPGTPVGVDCCYHTLELTLTPNRGEYGELLHLFFDPCQRFYYIGAKGYSTEELQADIIEKFNRRFFPSFAVADGAKVRFYLNREQLGCDCSLQTVEVVSKNLPDNNPVLNCDCVTGIVPPKIIPATYQFGFRLPSGNLEFADLSENPVTIELACGITLDLGEIMQGLYGDGPHPMDFFFSTVQGYFRALYPNSDMVFYLDGVFERVVAFYLSPTDFPECNCQNEDEIIFTGFPGTVYLDQPFVCFQPDPTDYLNCGERVLTGAPCILPERFARLKVQAFPSFPSGLGTYRFVPGFLKCDALTELPCIQPPTHLGTNNRLLNWLETSLFPAFPQYFEGSYLDYIDPMNPESGFYIYLDLSKRDWCRDTWKICPCEGDLDGFEVATELYCCPEDEPTNDADACPPGFAKTQITLKNDPDYIWNDPKNDAGFIIRGLKDALACAGVTWADIPAEMKMSGAGNFNAYLANVYEYLRGEYEVLGNTYLVLNQALGTITFYLDIAYFAQNLGIDLCTRSYSLCQAGYHTDECSVTPGRMRITLDMEDFTAVNDFPGNFSVPDCLHFYMFPTECLFIYSTDPFELAERVAEWINTCNDFRIVTERETYNVTASTNGKLLYLEWDGDCCGATYTVQSADGAFNPTGTVECCPAGICTEILDGYGSVTFTIDDPTNTVNIGEIVIGDPLTPCFTIPGISGLDGATTGIGVAQLLSIEFSTGIYASLGYSTIYTAGTNVITIIFPVSGTCCGQEATLTLLNTELTFPGIVVGTSESTLECCPGNCGTTPGMARLCFRINGKITGLKYDNSNRDASFFLQPTGDDCDPDIVPELSLAEASNSTDFLDRVLAFYQDLATTIGGGSTVTRNGQVFCLEYNVANFNALYGADLCESEWKVCTQSVTPQCEFKTWGELVFGNANQDVLFTLKLICNSALLFTYATFTANSGADITEFKANVKSAFEAIGTGYRLEIDPFSDLIFFYQPCTDTPCDCELITEIQLITDSVDNYISHSNINFACQTPFPQTLSVQIISNWCCPPVAEEPTTLPVQTLDVTVSKQPECCPPTGCAWADLEFELKELVPDEDDNVAWAICQGDFICPLDLVQPDSHRSFIFYVQDYSTYPSLNAVLQSFVAQFNDPPNVTITVTGNRMRIRVSRSWWFSNKGNDFCAMYFKVCSVGTVSDLIGQATVEITQQPECCGEECGKPCPEPDTAIVKLLVRENGAQYGSLAPRIGYSFDVPAFPCPGDNNLFPELYLNNPAYSNFVTYWTGNVAKHNAIWNTSYDANITIDFTSSTEAIITFRISISKWKERNNVDICVDGIKVCPDLPTRPQVMDWQLLSIECCTPQEDCPDIVDPPPPKVYDLCCGSEPEILYFQFNIPDRYNDYQNEPTAGWQDTKTGNWFATVEAIGLDGLVVPLSQLSVEYYVGRDRRTEKTYQGIKVNTEFLPNCFYLKFTFRTPPRETIRYSPLYRKTDGCCDKLLLFESMPEATDCNGVFYGIVDQFVGVPFQHRERLRLDAVIFLESFDIEREDEDGRITSSTGRENYRLRTMPIPAYVAKRLYNILMSRSFLIDGEEFVFTGNIPKKLEKGTRWMIDIIIQKKATCAIDNGCD